MFTLASYARKLPSILHPNARRIAKTTEFAEGIDPAAPVTLTIKNVKYIATTFVGDGGERGVRLSKQAGKGEVYDVHRSADGLTVCDCMSYINTYEGTSATCKHGTACIEAKLIEAPKPVMNPVSANLRSLVEPALLPANLPEVNADATPIKMSKILDKVEPATVAEIEPAPMSPMGDKAPRLWTAESWKRAAYFKLNPPKGQTPPKPVVVEPGSLITVISDMVTKPVTVTPLEMASFVNGPVEVPAIPAEVMTIRVLEGSAAGLWKRQPKRGRWVHEDDASDLDFSNVARWLSYTCADSWHLSGMVECVREGHHPIAKPSAPIKPPKPSKPVPASHDEGPRSPSSTDLAWHLGHSLGLEGDESARPSREWSDDLREAFVAGYAVGTKRYQQHLEELEEQAEAEAWLAWDYATERVFA